MNSFSQSSPPVERDALLRVQRMLTEGAPPEDIQRFLAECLGVLPSPSSLATMGTSAPDTAPGPATIASASAADRGGAGATTACASVAGVHGTPRDCDSILAGPTAGWGPSTPLVATPPRSTASRAPVLSPAAAAASGGPISVSAATSVTTNSASTTTIATAASSLLRLEARKDINAFLDASFTRVPMPRRHLGGPAVATALPAPQPAGIGITTTSVPAGAALSSTTSAGAGSGASPFSAQEMYAPPLSGADPRDHTSITAGGGTATANEGGHIRRTDVSRSALAGSVLSAAVPITAETPTGKSRPRAVPVAVITSAAPAAATAYSSVGDGVPLEVPSDPIGSGSTLYRRPRRVSIADSLAFAGDSQYSSLAGSIDSGLPLGATSMGSMLTAGWASGSATGGNSGGVNSHLGLRTGGYLGSFTRAPNGGRRRRNSTLSVTSRLAGLRRLGDSDGDDAVTGDDSDASPPAGTNGTNKTAAGNGALPGPRFGRLPVRDADAFVPLAETRQALADLGILFLPELHASEALTAEQVARLQTGTAATMVNPISIAEKHGLESFVHVAMNVFLRYRFMTRFGFDAGRLQNFLREAFTFFRPGNPHHHPIHATDIVIAAHQWLSQPSVAAHLSDEEILAFLFSATVMRVGHSGVNNRLLTQMRHPYAMMCSYGSPQQGATVALVMAILERPHNRFFPRIFHTKACEDESLSSSSSSLQVDVALGAANAVNASALKSEAHEWSQFREYQFFDLIAELVMATDERNHFVLQEGVARIFDDHFRAHGCLCPVRADEEHYATLACRRCCCYINDADLPAVLKAVLHFINYAFLFREFDVFITGLLVCSAEVYRQSECQARLLSTAEKLQRVAAREEQRASVARPATAASGASSSSTAATSPKREAAATAIVTAMHPAAGTATANAANAADADDAAAAVAAREEEDAAVAAVAQMRVEAAMLSEQPTWRDDALHSSTLSALRTIQALPTRMQERLLLPAGGAMGPSSRRGADAEGELGSSPSLSATFSTTLPHRALQGHARDIFIVSIEELFLPFLDTLAPYLPQCWTLSGRRNHERLMSALPTPEEYDLVVEKILFVTAPEAAAGTRESCPAGSGVAVAMSQHQHIPGYGRAPLLPTVAELRAAVPLARHIPFELIRRLVPAQPRWHFDADGIESRVLAEITAAGSVWTSFGALYKNLRHTKETAEAAQGGVRGGNSASGNSKNAQMEGKTVPSAVTHRVAAPLTGA